MGGSGGRFGKFVFVSITLIFLYISGSILLDGLVGEESSLVGAIIIVSGMWWVWAVLAQVLAFVFGSHEVSYEELKDEFRQRGYKVTEIDDQSNTQVSGGTGRTSSEGSSTGSRVSSNSRGVSSDNPQVRMRIGSDRSDDDKFLSDVADYFRAT
jgi:hypothetical protein